MSFFSKEELQKEITEKTKVNGFRFVHNVTGEVLAYVPASVRHNFTKQIRKHGAWVIPEERNENHR